MERRGRRIETAQTQRVVPSQRPQVHGVLAVQAVQLGLRRLQPGPHPVQLAAEVLHHRGHHRDEVWVCDAFPRLLAVNLLCSLVDVVHNLGQHALDVLGDEAEADLFGIRALLEIVRDGPQRPQQPPQRARRRSCRVIFCCLWYALRFEPLCHSWLSRHFASRDRGRPVLPEGVHERLDVCLKPSVGDSDGVLGRPYSVQLTSC
mmetsp:Transcript_102232/g.277867  ORF Transcript_102232/g.277867 Transcript_102232/m.277867 type:complete len:204 (+) Transcript_102232:44-655(+)